MTGTRFRSDAGISLVEIMVALFIVGISSSFVILSIPRSPTPLEEARMQIEDLLRNSERVAQLSGQPHGLMLKKNAAELLVFRTGGWGPPDDRNALANASWDEQVVLEREQRDTPRLRLEEEDAPVLPDVWFDGSGIATEAEFDLRWKSSRYTFSITRSGNINVQKTRSG